MALEMYQAFDLWHICIEILNIVKFHDPEGRGNSKIQISPRTEQTTSDITFPTLALELRLLQPHLSVDIYNTASTWSIR